MKLSPLEVAISESMKGKRARLLAKAAQAIDEYLEWEEQNPEPNLTQIEDIALRLRKEFGQEIDQMAIDNQEARTPAPGPKCAKCWKEMRYKGKKSTRVESWIGNLAVERGYYYCPKSQESVFPSG